MRYVNARNTAYGEDRRTYKESDSGVSSTQRAFNVSYDNGRVEAYLNGVRLFPGDDYTKTSSGIGTSITLASDLGSNNVLEIVGYQGINSGNALVEDNFVVGTGSTGSGGSYTNSTTVFPVASSAGDTVSVWRNGIKLVPTTDYTVDASANTVTLVNPGASTDDEITVQVVGALQHENLVQKENAEFNSGNNSYTMPTTRGADGQVLTRTGTSGATTWATTVTQPAITSVTTPASDNSINEDDNVAMTINGSNFTNSMTVSLIDATSGNPVTGHGNLGIASFISGVQIVVNTVAGTTNNAISNSNVKVKIDKSGLTATSASISVSPDPAFTSPATGNPTLATIFETTGQSVEVVGSTGIVATASDSASIEYALTGGTTNGDWQFDTSTGVITSPSSGVDSVSSGTSYQEAFTVTATAGGESNRTDSRTFKIVVNKAPTEPTGVTANDWTDSSGVIWRVLAFKQSSSAMTWTTYTDVTLDYLLIGGGGSGGSGSGGGGGGAGGFLSGTSYTLSAGTYTVTIGLGGVPNTASTTYGSNGGETKITNNSSTDILKAIGGGTGGNEDPTYYDGVNGGSGGGGSQQSSSIGTGGNHIDTGAVDVTNVTTNHIGTSGGSSVSLSSHWLGGGGGGAGDGGTGAINATSGSDGGDGKKAFWGLTDAQTTAMLAKVSAGVPESDGFRWLAGGGGGMRQGTNNTSAPGGKGGGGIGGNYQGTNQGGSDGTANTGGGGGGAHDAYGGVNNGGTGIVIIRYAIT